MSSCFISTFLQSDRAGPSRPVRPVEKKKITNERLMTGKWITNSGSSTNSGVSLSRDGGKQTKTTSFTGKNKKKEMSLDGKSTSQAVGKDDESSTKSTSLIGKGKGIGKLSTRKVMASTSKKSSSQETSQSTAHSSKKLSQSTARPSKKLSQSTARPSKKFTPRELSPQKKRKLNDMDSDMDSEMGSDMDSSIPELSVTTGFEDSDDSLTLGQGHAVGLSLAMTNFALYLSLTYILVLLINLFSIQTQSCVTRHLLCSNDLNANN